MVDALVCFCTEKKEEQIKQYIRDNMKPTDEINNDLIYKVHKAFAEGVFMGRCCGCMDEVEELMHAYKEKRWS